MNSSATVTAIDPRPAASDLSLLDHTDYEDCFLVSIETDRTAEEWARAMIEGAPQALRDRLRRGWMMLGLRHGPAAAPDRVLGWEIRRNVPDVLMLGADSWIGMPGELLFKREPDGLLFATFIQQSNPLAKLVWGRIASEHRRIVSEMLERAASRPWPPGAPQALSRERAQSATESPIGRGSQPSSVRARSLDI